MIYLDTSVLVAMHMHETSTVAVLTWYGQMDATPICSSVWCVTEFASAISIKQRTGQATRSQAAQAWKQFEAQCVGDLRLLQVNSDTFKQAALLALGPRGLRAGDALHLAAAGQARIRRLLTLDAVMRENATRLGMQAVNMTEVGGA